MLGRGVVWRAGLLAAAAGMGSAASCEAQGLPERNPGRHSTAGSDSTSTEVGGKPRATMLAPPARRATRQPSDQQAPSTSRAAGDSPIRLSRPRNPGNELAGGSSSKPFPMVARVLGSLAVVVALFLGVAWLCRRSLPKSALGLPQEAVEVLGRTALGPRQQVQLVRVGRRVLLVAAGGSGVNTLTEITDAQEVENLLAVCRQNHPASISTSFRQVLHELGGADYRQSGGRNLAAVAGSRPTQRVSRGSTTGGPLS